MPAFRRRWLPGMAASDLADFLAGFSYDQAWRVDKHVRLLADIDNDDMADIVGFGDAGVQTALATGDGGFSVSASSFRILATIRLGELEKHDRLLADMQQRFYG